MKSESGFSLAMASQPFQIEYLSAAWNKNWNILKVKLNASELPGLPLAQVAIVERLKAVAVQEGLGILHYLREQF